MKTAWCAIILLAAAYCFVEIESQCKGHVSDRFSAYYFRVIKIGEDNYERLDDGEMVYDGIGQRVVYIPDPNSPYTRKMQREFTCYDNSAGGGFVSITVDLNGHCTVKPTSFYNFEVPDFDYYQLQLFVGGLNDEMEESLYGGQDKRERNELALTTSKCGPTFFAISSADNNFHVRMQFFSLNTTLPLDAFKIQCSGQQPYECGASLPRF